MRKNLSPSAGSTIVNIIPVNQGGTGATSQSSALTVFDGIPANTVDQPNGVAGLDSNGKMSINNFALDEVSVISIDGPVSVVKGSITEYTISNFDAFTDYVLTALSGTVVLVDNVVIYSAPATPVTGGFTINGRTITIDVTDYKPVTPVISVSDFPGNPVTLEMASSPFVMQGNTDTHLDTDWQVSTTSDFSGGIRVSLNDSVNKVAVSFDSSDLSTHYYVRCRHRSSGNFVSDWSLPAEVITKANYVVQTQEAALSIPGATEHGLAVISSDGTRLVMTTHDSTTMYTSLYVQHRSGSAWTSEASFTNISTYNASAVDISKNGDRIILGLYHSPSSTDTGGSCEIYRRDGLTWTVEQTIYAPDPQNDNCFGSSVCFNAEGDLAFIGAYNTSSNNVLTGALYVFKRQGLNWSCIRKIVPPQVSANDALGSSITVSADSSRIAVGAPNTNNGLVTTTGAVYILKRNAIDNWELEQEIGNPYSLPPSSFNENFGSGISLNKNGDLIAIGAPGRNAASGVVYIYKRTGTLWTKEFELTGSGVTGYMSFGGRVKFNSDSTRLFISCSNYGSTAYSNGYGAVFIFKKVSNSWIEEKKILCPDTTPNSQFFGGNLSIDEKGMRFATGAAKIGGTGKIFVYTT